MSDRQTPDTTPDNSVIPFPVRITPESDVPAVETDGCIDTAALVVDLMQWREDRGLKGRTRPGKTTRRAQTMPPSTSTTGIAPGHLPAYFHELDAGAEWVFPSPNATITVQRAWEEAVAPLNERDRRVAAAVFLAEIRTAGLRPDLVAEVGYRHLVARLLYRDELVWRRHHGAFHAFARSLLIRFAMALSRQGVA